MTSAAVLLALLSGLAWSGLDVARKFLMRDLRPTVVAVGLSVGMAALFGGWSVLAPGPVDLSSYSIPAAISVVLVAGVQLCMLESLRRAELSRTIPLLSLTPVATSLFGFAVLDERLTPIQWLGVLLVCAGALLLGSWTPDEGGSRRRMPFDGGLLLMLAAALLISAAAPFDKLAIGASSVALHGFIQSAGVALILVVILSIRGDLDHLGKALSGRPLLLGAGLLAFAAVALQFAAYQGLMVGIVETIKRVVGLVGALGAGRVLFGEKITGAKLLAVGLMAIGVALILA